MAVVISKSEQKAAFIDLKPLFSYVNSVYFGGDQATFNARMASLGQADNQWPYTFAQQPSQVPTVVEDDLAGQRPTAVKTTRVRRPEPRPGSRRRTARCTSTAWTATPTAVRRRRPRRAPLTEVGTVTGIGRNPTSIADSKGEPSGNIEPRPRCW